ncbi:MAG: hypothetical protein ACI9BD_000235 [Candidatus Marinamargulisbacteria bacterium]|jgi:hypothetical protein
MDQIRYIQHLYPPSTSNPETVTPKSTSAPTSTSTSTTTSEPETLTQPAEPGFFKKNRWAPFAFLLAGASGLVAMVTVTQRGTPPVASEDGPVKNDIELQKTDFELADGI